MNINSRNGMINQFIDSDIDLFDLWPNDIIDHLVNEIYILESPIYHFICIA